MIGELLSGAARRKGIAGVVVDGPVRDVATLAGWADFPVFSRGRTARGPSSMDRGSVNEPVVFGGVRVVPGDLILGDDDGLVAIPAGELAAQLPAALAMVRAEAAWEARLAGGETTLEVFNVPPAAIRLAGSQHRRAQPLVDLGHDAAPVGEAGRGLMQQHAQTLDRDVAATARAAASRPVSSGA